MSKILFSLSNIMIPLILITYKTAIRVRKTGQNGCGQWFCLIIFTFISNMLYYIADESKIYILGDLIIKLAICFMPKGINETLEKKISHMHLEILFERVRSYLIQQFYIFHSFLTILALSKMDDVEQIQFKQAIIAQLQNQISQPNSQISEKQSNKNRSKQKKKSTKLSSKLNAAKKHYDNIGVSCDILTPAMLQNLNNQKKQLKKSSADRKFPRATGGTQQGESLQRQQSSVQLVDGQSFMKKKNSILIHRSTTDLGIQEKQQRPRMISSGVKTKTQAQTDTKHPGIKYPQKPQYQPKMQTIKEPVIRFEAEQPSLILNKLDVSQYSDMFEQDQQSFASEFKQLLTKVQAIVQIGTGSSVRLQIYNIQLYSNDQIRIMSLYGRQFQKHKLVAIMPQKHGYYELKLDGGKVKRRRVKFRGKIDPFVKFLQPAEN